VLFLSKRIDKDDLRNMLDCYVWNHENEKFVEETRDYLITQCLKQGKSVIIDDTNLHVRHENKIKDIIQHISNATGKPIAFTIKWFHITLEEAINRNSMRTGTAQVGQKVIEDMYKKYSSIIDKTDTTVTINPINKNHYDDENLPAAIICDIDGTVAKAAGREFFEWDKVDEDNPKMPIINMINCLSSKYKIIFFSGRDEVCKEKTISWLKQYFKFDIELYMRTHNDNRKDNIIKTELYHRHIFGKYFVEFAVDDRDQVVDAWRNVLGKTCLQVDYGNF
jgi:predicted kinase